MDPEVVQGGGAPGMTLGSYRIERLLGRGGMGAVFLAYDTTLHRQVALKVVDAPADGDTSGTQLLREARNAAALNHPNICTIHEVGDASGSAFIAMEYVEGRSLSDRLDEGALPLDEAVRYGLQAADALAYAHDHGVIHRDFKAANAIVTVEGRLKIVDFGLARRDDVLMANATTMASLVPAGTAAGTPYAMAPEQVCGDSTDARTDIWALGVLLYEMVAGAKPFSAATIPELFSSILRDSPAALPDAVPVAMRALIERCLDKKPEQRYQHAGEVRAALDAIQTGTIAPWITWRYYLRRRRWLVSAAALLGIGAVLVGLNVGGVRDRLVGNQRETVPIKLAVLPFENLTGDPEQEYFSDGLTEEMITQLGRLHPQELSVIARTSSMRYKKSDKPVDQIGRELGVDYLLEGSARQERGRVKINATLVRVSDQTQRWTDSYERELASILTVQGEVARAITRSLSLALVPAEQARLASARPVNPEAYDAYLKGRFHSYTRTPENLEAAMRYFRSALQKEPDYALAYAGIGGVWWIRGNLLLTPFQEAHAQAKSAALKAIELDDRLAEGHDILGRILVHYEWDWPAAEKAYRRAIELNPNYPDARHFYSGLLMLQGRPQEAKPQIEKAIELDPLNAFSQGFYAYVLGQMRRYDDAIVQARKTLGMAEPFVTLLHQVIWRAFHQKRMYQEALAEAKVIFAADPEIVEALSRGYAEGGYSEANRRAAEKLAVRAKLSFWERENVAILYAFAGQKARALDWLENGYETHHSMMSFIGIDPHWDDLRSEPRFDELLRKLNLPQSHTKVRGQ